MTEQISTIEDYVAETNHMFYVDYPWITRGELDDLFKQYFIRFVTGYELSKEKKIPHIQCYGVCTPARYRAFIAKYKCVYEAKTGEKPTGRATAGGRKNYGRVRGVLKSVENCIAYCIKDGNYSFYNIPNDVMEKSRSISYKVEGIKEKKQEMERICRLNKSVWEGDAQSKLVFLAKITQKHFELFGMPLAKSTMEKYLLKSGLVTFTQYAKANFDYLIMNYQQYDY